MPNDVQLVAAGVRALGFAGMGAALLRTRSPRETPQTPDANALPVHPSADPLVDVTDAAATGATASSRAYRDIAMRRVDGMERAGKVLMGLLLFNGVSSIGGGIALMTGLIPEQAEWVEHTDFASLYLPGVILMAVVGGSSTIAAVAMAKHSEGWQICSIAAGVIMLFWIVGEIASIRGFHFLQVIYFVTGALVVWYTPRSRSQAGQRT